MQGPIRRLRASFPRRLSAGGGVVFAVCGIAMFGSAASLGGIAPAGIGAAGSPIPACDTAFTVAFTTSHGNATAVLVGDIADPACEGGDLTLTVTGSAGAVIASSQTVAVPTDADATPDSIEVPITPNPAAEQVAGIRISVVGP